MRKLIVFAVVCNFAGLTTAQAARSVFDDLNQTAPRGGTIVSTDIAARDPFDRINSTAPVRKPTPADDVMTGE